MEKVIEYGAVKLGLKRSNLRDRMIADGIWLRLDTILPKTEIGAENHYRRLFSRIVAQTTCAEGLDWKFPAPQSSDAELAAGFEAFMALDGDLGERWIDALGEVDAPPGDPRFLPPEKTTDDIKKK